MALSNVTVFASNTYAVNGNDLVSISVLDPKFNAAVSTLDFRTSFDESLKTVLPNIKVSALTENDLINGRLSKDETIAVSEEAITSESVSRGINKAISTGEPVYIYGDKIDLNNLEEISGIDIVGDNDDGQTEEDWDIVGFKDGKIDYLSKVTIKEEDTGGNIIEPTSDIFIQSVVSRVIDNKNKVTSQTVTPMNTDPIRKSEVNIVASELYLRNAFGETYLAGKLYLDWWLRQSSDNDPNKDYFYPEN